MGKGVCAPLPCPVLLPAQAVARTSGSPPTSWDPKTLWTQQPEAAGLTLGAAGDQCHPALVCQATRPPGRLPQPSAKPRLPWPRRRLASPVCWPLMPCCRGHSWRGIKVRFEASHHPLGTRLHPQSRRGARRICGVVQGLRSHLPMQKTLGFHPWSWGTESHLPGAAEPTCQ